MYPYWNNQYYSHRYRQYNQLKHPFLSNADQVYYQGRLYTRRRGLMSPATWIEKGPDGRPYYVKRRSAAPSLRQKFAEVIDDLRQRNTYHGPPVSSPPPDEQPPSSAPAPAPSRPSTPGPKSSLKQKSQPAPEMVERNTTPAYPGRSHAQAPQSLQPQHFPPYPFFPTPTYPQLGNDNNAHGQQNNAIVPAHIPHFAAPHPRMYPYVPSGNQALTGPPTSMPSNTSMGYNPAGPPVTHPSSAPHGHAASNPGQLAMAPLSVNPDDLKYKCSVCGQFRSSRYQWKHRVPAGQLPGPTICRRCRQEATESEVESTHSYEERDYRSHSRSRHRLRGVMPRPRSRARSSSRGRRRVDFDYYAHHAPEESSSESDDVEVRPRRAKSRSRRARSPNVEVVRYVDGDPDPSRSKSRSRKKVVYIEKPRHDETSDEDEVEIRYISVPQRTRSTHSRSNTPAPRYLTRQYSDPDFEARGMLERRDYCDGPPAPRRMRHNTSSRLAARDPLRHGRSSSRLHGDHPHDRHELSENEYFYEPAIEQEPRGRMRGGHGRSRSRSRSRVSIDEGAESRPTRQYLPPAPSAPLPRRGRRSSSLAYVDTTADGSANDAYQQVHAGSSSQRKRRSDDEYVTVEEDVAPADDYDMYDRDGMRVRVREI